MAIGTASPRPSSDTARSDLELTRRGFLRNGALLAGGVGLALLDAARRTARASEPNLEEIAAAAEETGEMDGLIRIRVPDQVEDGSAVPVAVESSLPDTREILIMVEKNPIPLAARFRIPEGTEPRIWTRIKMAESGTIRAIVRAGDRVHARSADTRITLGGCR